MKEKEIDYRKIEPGCRAAWIAYKRNYSGAGKPSAVSFVAGWNAQKTLDSRS